jgi:GntR family transcriptional regulator, transcriptional repressor for pyruvate dehydrogenase complex
MSSASRQPATLLKAAESIAETLRREIVNQMSDGDALGSAQELMSRFQVSGPTIRQAMRVLEAEGLVRARRGNSGGFFAGTPSEEVVTRAASALLQRRGADLSDMMLLSELIGSEYVGLAAENPDAAARLRAQSRVSEMLKAGDRGDVDFAAALEVGVTVPRVLGELSGSPTLALFAVVTGDLVVGLMGGIVPMLGPRELESYARRVRESYLRLFDAVTDGDATRARNEWQRIHLIGADLVRKDRDRGSRGERGLTKRQTKAGSEEATSRQRDRGRSTAAPTRVKTTRTRVKTR